MDVDSSFNCEHPAVGIDKSFATLSLLLMSNSSSFAAMSTTLEAF